jgi:hypothetical protein
VIGEREARPQTANHSIAISYLFVPQTSSEPLLRVSLIAIDINSLALLIFPNSFGSFFVHGFLLLAGDDDISVSVQLGVDDRPTIGPAGYSGHRYPNLTGLVSSYPLDYYGLGNGLADYPAKGIKVGRLLVQVDNV